MKKHFKKISSLILAFALIFGLSTTCYAATHHKVNGAASPEGGTLSYDSTITRNCNSITAEGHYFGTSGGSYSVVVVVQKGGITVASGTIRLDGKEHTLDSYVDNRYSAGTYHVTVTPLGGFNASYDTSTHFYY